MELGELITSHGINQALIEDDNFEKELRKCWLCYLNQDWEDVDEKIVSYYLTSKGDVIIITEYDKKRTIIMFSDEH